MLLDVKMAVTCGSGRWFKGTCDAGILWCWYCSISRSGYTGLFMKINTVYGNLSGFKLKIYAFSTCLSRVLCSVPQSCLTLCNPMASSPPGFSFNEISKARILEQVAIFYSRESSQPRDQTRFSCISCIGRQILYHSATWEALCLLYLVKNLKAV